MTTAGAGPRYARAALVGTGYIGGSLLLALRARGLVGRVIGYDLDGAALDVAMARGIVDERATSAEAAAAVAELLVVGTPVGATASVLAEIAPVVDAGALIVDVGSTKAEVVAAAEALLRRPVRLVGAHPLAGREHQGPGAATADLFEGRPCLLTPTLATHAGAVEECAALWEEVGARVTCVTPEMHDRLMALVSHLPHVAAFALGGAVAATLDGDEALARVTPGLWGGGFADTTRICASNPAMWRDVLLANRAALAPLLARLAGELGDLARALEAGDGEAIASAVRRAGRGRALVMTEPEPERQS